MLRRLQIENYGLIDRADIEFSEHATMFTGETGSGKTMIFGALAFALGARAGGDTVRRGAQRAIVALSFEPDERLRERLEELGFGIDPDEDASIVREMSEAGKSSLRLNGRASSASQIREIASAVVETVGQHEAQRLLLPAYQLELLDRYGGEDATVARAAVSRAYETLNGLEDELAALETDDRKAREHYDDARMTLEDVAAVAPEPGEDVRLGDRRRFLDNVERIASALRIAHEALAGDETSASAALGAAKSALDGVASLGNELEQLAGVATVLQSEVTEAAVGVARLLDVTEFDATELDEINGRLDALDRLKRKYGGTLNAVLERASQARATVDAFEGRGEQTALLREHIAQARARLTEDASALTAVRKAAAQRLLHAVEAEFSDLALASARFDVLFAQLAAPAAGGAESIEFAFAANAGEPLRPLARVASGGELSRVLLALIVVLARVREPVALALDEIDAGIGGVTATAVGARIGRLAQSAQVVCVTHLAQLATWAGRHYVLEKRETGGNTTIAVRAVESDDERAAELARMLSGESHDVALAHARTLLQAVANVAG